MGLTGCFPTWAEVVALVFLPSPGDKGASFPEAGSDQALAGSALPLTGLSSELLTCLLTE